MDFEHWLKSRKSRRNVLRQLGMLAGASLLLDACTTTPPPVVTKPKGIADGLPGEPLLRHLFWLLPQGRKIWRAIGVFAARWHGRDCHSASFFLAYHTGCFPFLASYP